MMPPRVTPISPYHHFGGVVLHSHSARLDHPELKVWVVAPEIMPWPRRASLWRPTIVHEPARRPTFREWCRAAWRGLLTDPREVMP